MGTITTKEKASIGRGWAIWRLPQEEEVHSCASSHCRIVTEGDEVSGFWISPFDSRRWPSVVIPFDFLPGEFPIFHVTGAKYRSTTRSEHILNVKRTLDAIHRGTLDKCVIARVANIPGSIDIRSNFDSLCKKYPTAFVFAFSTEATGTWLGASPELLLKSSNREVSTMAVAGTKPCDDRREWDSKNIAEHEFVSSFIAKTLQAAGSKQINIEERDTVSAGRIRHLVTRINAIFPEGADVYAIPRRLAPTPALAGSPRDKSMEWISRCEDFDRTYYGGFCGPVTPKGMELYVNLRSGRITEDGVDLFAGGGIVADSNPEDEWNETEMKISTLRDILK